MMATPASNIETLHERTRILVVEDEPIIRLYIAEALREMGAVVIEAGTADEAWAFLTTGADVDLVFTDHRMPGAMSGAELATRIRQSYPGLAVLVTSGVLDTSDWPEPIIEKPYGVIATAVSIIRRARNARNQAPGRTDSGL
jgi:CheY-like chemotaxis protein